ncbi:pseudouridylate synthase 7 homolog [Cylas formicarius]|uniref:pseudouridylate synthase 7 homolog n=1 Tax=Cylas formicarius TaxID=197179 RepID=UPI0029587377|nr:pseudouridylate synthase 7 homolog [Cylas formicarius]
MPFKKRNRRTNFKKHFGSHSRNTGSKPNGTQFSVETHPDRSEELGITEYVSTLEGFPAVIKSRYSDFQVNEIDLEGNVAKLTDTSIPGEFATKLQQVDYKQVEASPIEKVSQEQWVAMKNLVQGGAEDVVAIDASDMDKDARKALHQSVEKYFGRKIISNTVVVDGKPVVQMKKYDKDVKERKQWPNHLPDFVHFVVYKEMLDTMDACLKIAQQLKISPGKVTYAGVKDRRAKTTQWFCVRRAQPWKLITKTNSQRNIKVGNVKFRDAPLKLGDLSGNRFRIALRNVVADDDVIKGSLESLRLRGFINYYGNQRFGNDRETPTYSIGDKLISGRWKEAIDLILKVKTGDDQSTDLSKAKKIYAETGDAEKALKVLGTNRNSIEAKLLEGLAQNDVNDYVNALEKIPRNMRLMYVHSFQSLVWNKMASERIRKFGLEVVEGDLVSDEDGENQAEADENSTEVVVNRKCVKVVSATEVQNYTIYDVVLPLPGYDVTYPENLKDSYKELLGKYDLTLEMPKQSVRSYNLSGAYRKLCARVQDLSWNIMYYSKPTDDLIRSDFEELKGLEEPKSVENGEFKALVLEFRLKPASYATMVLRELLKCDTSSHAQAQLNHYASSKVGERILMGEDGNKDETSGTVGPIGLLEDKERYEDFMKLVFCDGTKRKMEGNGDDDDASRKRTKADGS